MENKRAGYFDFDVEIEKTLIDGGLLGDLFYLRDLKQRKLFINTDIDQEAIFDAVKNIMQYNKEDVGIEIENRQPIILYLTSNGGEVDAGFELGRI